MKYCGLKRAGDLAGKRVRLVYSTSNGSGEMPAGTQGVVLGEPNEIRNGRIRFQADQCKCCGFRWRVGGLEYGDIELAT